MQFLSGLSFIGLLAFIAFSTVGRADGWQERHDDYDRGTDPVVIIEEEYDQDMYEFEVEVDVDVRVRDSRRNDNRRNYHPTPAPPVLPYPGAGHGPIYGQLPICRVFKINNSFMYDLWVGNGIYRRGDYNFISQVYWGLVNSGGCTRGNW